MELMMSFLFFNGIIELRFTINFFTAVDIIFPKKFMAHFDNGQN